MGLAIENTSESHIDNEEETVQVEIRIDKPRPPILNIFPDLQIPIPSTTSTTTLTKMLVGQKAHLKLAKKQMFTEVHYSLKKLYFRLLLRFIKKD